MFYFVIIAGTQLPTMQTQTFSFVNVYEADLQISSKRS